ncbi:MAG: nucleotide sugar dehydrogenase [Gammaproteobacteria bacterium]|nr:nucleotide sugar dehydrogenase [Gammaproteobacteria bacterium]
MTSTPSPRQPLPTGDTVVGVIGLGYVGLPLAVALGQHFRTIGFDTDKRRIVDLKRGVDLTREVDAEELTAARQLRCTADATDLEACDVLIVAVPTPIDEAKQPDLRALRAAGRTVGEVIRRGDIVIFESTVYPGATEEVAIPIVEQHSGLVYNRDFFAGYSPERMNPGDRQHRLRDIVKVTAGSTPETLAFVDALYGRIVAAGTHPVADIRTAEAAKVIENTQRDLNIALVNEFAMIFDRLGLDTEAVLDAAATKWNFMPFRPGLVGGHCIGVDPYYLTHKAQAVGFSPDLVLAGRRVNDSMPNHVAERVAALMAKAGIAVAGARILILGLAFKENCPDVRNTKVVDLVAALAAHAAAVDVFDPWVTAPTPVNRVDDPEPGTYDAIVVAVAHDAFRDLGAERIRAFGKPRCVVFDVKHLLPASAVDGRL